MKSIIDYLHKRRKKLLPLLISVMIHLIALLALDDLIDFDIALPEKQPDYVFIEPVLMSHPVTGNTRTLEEDLEELQSQIKPVEEIEIEQAESEIKQREIETSSENRPVILPEESRRQTLSFSKDIEAIDIQETFQERQVQTEVVERESPRALIDREEFTPVTKITPPELSADRERIEIPDRKPSMDFEEVKDTQRESPVIQASYDKIDIEIESISQEHRKIPQLIALSQPEYPQWAIEANYEGYVQFRINVNKNGSVSSISRHQSDLPTDFVAYTADYLRRWVFSPLIINDERVESQILVTIVYRLE
ncbi:MAG: energy transducer TonB [Candidatus Muiribacteriota bacterium]